jgi:cobalamin biosynthesis protein CbiG
MHSLKQQAGASYWGVMAMIMVLVVSAQFGMIAAPVYLDDVTISKVIEDRLRVAKNTDNYAELERSIEKQLELNNMQNTKVKDILTITSDGGVVKVHKKYEVRQKFISNIDIVIHFDQTFDQKQVQASGS